MVDNDQWTTVIEPQKPWFDLKLKEAWKYRDLIALFVRRDFVAGYKQTLLGPFWFVLQPLVNTLVFTVVFGNIARIPTDGLPQMLFYMAGTVTWNYFANCLVKTADIFAANANIFGKVYFPRITVPIATVITNLATFGIQFCVFLALMAYFYLQGSAIHPNLLILLVPLLLLEMAVLGLGTGIFISSLTTRYRDLAFLITFGAQLWMYATPIVYPASQIPERWLWLYNLNPMAPVIETFRYAFLGAGSFRPDFLLVSFIITAVIMVLGLVIFSRVEQSFVDTI